MNGRERPEPRLVPHDGAERLARDTARRVLEVLESAQDERGEATLLLTGGSMGTRVVEELARQPEVQAVDWSRVNVWWSDERFLPGADSERNGVQAADAWDDSLELDWDRVHPVAGSDEIDTAAAAAEDYREELAAAAEMEGTPGALPRFDVALLSLGPDTHVASLFPGRQDVLRSDRTVFAVADSPKPPPTRVTLSLPAINSADRVWLLVSGTAKAGALAAVRRPGATPVEAPGSAVRGVHETLWLVTEDALPGVPEDPTPN
ncbi:6-phosphogluconolactonase [Kocuria tytonicola]|uniref:6-phosphogluconolactonase n=1 Tax=Kocuria tytonicola TaxID=2055946 RepID=A0A3L9L967_9MICC|nr:6-phosphogluconolactonase [Kocuria tytonicola]RLY94908.1 6-phosphogluconolactonase [Kocuria tytonicola]